MTRRLLVTPLGWVILVGALVCCSVGWWLGWVELLSVGVGCVLAIVLAVPFIIGGSELALERSLEPKRVPVGDPARSVLSIRANRRGRSTARLISDYVDGRARLVDVPDLGPDLSIQHPMALPTFARGVVRVGPAEVTKGDPLGLLRHALARTSVSEMWVYPRIVPLSSMQSGFVKDLEGPTYDNSPAGDVAFHTIREYAAGDDIRHIHWMSTARTGSLMIRHYVDNRLPYLGVLVDPRASAQSAASFEVALQVAASQFVSASLDSRPISVWVGDQQISTEAMPADRSTGLDRFCMSAQVDSGFDLVNAVDRLFQIDTGVSAVLVLTGPVAANDLLPVAVRASRDGAVFLGRVLERPEPAISLPRASLIDFFDAEGFATHWRGIVQ